MKFGKNRQGKQRYQCHAENCLKKTFILDYENKGYLPEIKKRIIEMTLNGSGIRDISRVLGISMNTVMSELKKKEKENEIRNINYQLSIIEKAKM